MLLYVMRHGPAEDRAPTGRDFDRVLTRDGREVVARAARSLHEARTALGPRSLRLLSSPFRRARETAEIVAGLVGPSAEIEVHDDLGADAGTPVRLVDEISAAGTDAILVGHQPYVEDLVRELIHPARAPFGGAGFRTALVVTLTRSGSGAWSAGAVIDPHR